MMFLRLVRISESGEGTFGALKLNERPFCVTLEPPDRLNEVQVSQIPAGQYICKRVKSPKFGDTWEVTNVPHRSNVLIHAGNVVEHTAGCIIVGSSYGKLKGDWAVLNSGNTFKDFMTETAGADELHLTIVEEL